eukprot:tig00000880_g5164.t1
MAEDGEPNKAPAFAAAFLGMRPPPLFDSRLCEIVPKLFLGSMMAARQEEKMKAAGVTHVLTITKLAKKPEFPNDFTYLVLEEDDNETSDLLSKLPLLILFIETARASGGVLVHCAMGVSRSGAVVVAYLMAAFSMSRDEALAQVRKARPQVEPNRGFMRQLAVFQAMGAPRNFDARECARARLALLASERAAGGGVAVFRAQPSVVTLHERGHAKPLRITGQQQQPPPPQPPPQPQANGGGAEGPGEEEPEVRRLRAAGAACVGELEEKIARAGRVAAYVGSGLACRACRRPLLRSLNLLPHPLPHAHHAHEGEGARAGCGEGECGERVWRAVLSEAARRGSAPFEELPHAPVLFLAPDGAVHASRDPSAPAAPAEPTAPAPPRPAPAPDVSLRPPSRCACAVPLGLHPTPACSVHFVEPLGWMGDVAAEEGHLACPCGAPLGAWSWRAGLPCACGGHLAPAFAVHREALVEEAPL